MSSVENSVEVQRGYPLRIFKQKDHRTKYKCAICDYILRDPVQAECGHRFCRQCIFSTILNGERTVKCVQCEKEDDSDNEVAVHEIFPDNAIKREMSKQKVRCSNDGCKWTGSFKEYETRHTMECEYTMKPCEVCGEDVNILTRKEHNKTTCRTECQLCQESLLTINRQSHLDEECPKVIKPCPDCKHECTREQMQAHLDTKCPVRNVTCLACHDGGEVMIRRSGYHDHFNENKHTAWVMDVLRSVREKQNVLEEHLTKERLPGVNVSIGGTLTPGELHKQMETHFGNINDRVDVKLNTLEGICNTICRELSKCTDAILKLDQHRLELKHHNETLAEKVGVLERNSVIKDQTITKLETLLTESRDISYDGTYIWRLSNFSQLNDAAAAGQTKSLYSPSFYTSKNGYKLCGRIYPDGDGLGKGSHLSVFIVVQRGNFDPLLSWPFKHRVAFSVLNQAGKEDVRDSFLPDTTSSSFDRPTSDMNVASGCPMFVRLDELRDPKKGLLVDDTLFLKFTVGEEKQSVR